MTVYVRTIHAGTAKYVEVASVKYNGDEFVITLDCKEQFTARYPNSEVIDIIMKEDNHEE